MTNTGALENRAYPQHEKGYDDDDENEIGEYQTPA
jgi:hypothetical protein